MYDMKNNITDLRAPLAIPTSNNKPSTKFVSMGIAEAPHYGGSRLDQGGVLHLYAKTNLSTASIKYKVSQQSMQKMIGWLLWHMGIFMLFYPLLSLG